MMSGEKSAIISGKSAFSAVVDEACERLMDRQVKYSIERIHQMESRLAGLERELDEFLVQKDRK
ncbi:hypothetical protein AGMMS50293_08520 [Spirochaetia bacterium]|nr:hypothetical protein AGMMS50293_08520 [Spirochaetia bacterium]